MNSQQDQFRKQFRNFDQQGTFHQPNQLQKLVSKNSSKIIAPPGTDDSEAYIDDPIGMGMGIGMGQEYVGNSQSMYVTQNRRDELQYNQILVLGDSRSGKTTLLKVIHGAYVGVPANISPFEYSPSQVVEEMVLEQTALLEPLRFVVPPGADWNEAIAVATSNKLLGGGLIQNPFLELKNSTNLIIYTMSLANASEIRLGFNQLVLLLSRWFMGTPVIILWTKLSELADPSNFRLLPTLFPGCPLTSLDDALNFLALEILEQIRPYSYGKIRLLSLKTESQKSQVVKTLEETNAYTVFAETCQLIAQKLDRSAQ